MVKDPYVFFCTVLFETSGWSAWFMWSSMYHGAEFLGRFHPILTWAMNKNPGCLGFFRGIYRPAIWVLLHKPLHGSLSNNQYTIYHGMSHCFFFRAHQRLWTGRLGMRGKILHCGPIPWLWWTTSWGFLFRTTLLCSPFNFPFFCGGNHSSKFPDGFSLLRWSNSNPPTKKLPLKLTANAPEIFGQNSQDRYV